MLSRILDCSSCGHRFNYEYEGVMPQEILCPNCGKTAAQSEYSALVICQSCHTKLRIPLDMVYDNDNICPQCGKTLDPKTFFDSGSMDDKLDSLSGGSASEGSQQLQPGEFFDKYKVIKLLGKGGMAEVYLAEHLLLHRLCALKLMRGNMAADDFVFIKRFLQEAKLLNSIEHENIVKVYDVGSDFKSGTLFIAMEYVEGKTLLDILRDHKFSAGELQYVLVAMGHALQALADAQVVHRDIKPSNIMMTKDGVLKLMDLGIAKFSGAKQEGEMTLTMEQSTIGTPNYASPEQCRSARNVDIRSDIYCLGTTLYHLASGRLPFDGDTPVATILNVMQKEAEPLKQFRPDLPEKLLDLIMQMMQKDPDERPATPDQLLAFVFSQKNQISGNIIQKSLRRGQKFMRKQLLPQERSLKGYLLNYTRLAVAAGLLIVIVVLTGGLVKNYRTWRADAVETALAAGKSQSEAASAGSPGKYLRALIGNNSKEEVISLQRPDSAKKSEETASAAALQKKSPVAELTAYPSFFYQQLLPGINADKMPVINGDFLQDKARCTSYDFACDLPLNTLIDRSAVLEGVLCCDGSDWEISANRPEWAEFIRSGKNSITLMDFNMINATISVDFMLENNLDTEIISLFGSSGSRTLQIALEDGKLVALFGNNTYARTGVELPKEKFINVTLTMNKSEQLFAIYCGNRLAGAWLLPEEFFNTAQQFLRFGGSKRNFHGGVARLQAWNHSIAPDENAETSFAPLAADEKRPSVMDADNGAVACYTPWKYQEDAADWDNDGFVLNHQSARGGKPFLVLLCDAYDTKSYMLLKYLQDEPEVRKYIENKFTAIYLPRTGSMQNVALEQYRRNKLILDKIGKLPASYPAFAVFDKYGEWISGAVCADNAAIFDQLAALYDFVSAFNVPGNTIDNRLKKVSAKITKLEAQQPGKLRDAQLNFAREQLKVLQQQQEIRSDIVLKNKNFNAVATDKFRNDLVVYLREFDKYRKTLERENTHKNEENWSEYRDRSLPKLIAQLNSGKVDPDLRVAYNNTPGGVYLIDLVFSLPRSSGLRHLGTALLNNGADVNNCKANMPIEFYYLGMENIPLSAVESMISPRIPKTMAEFEENPFGLVEICQLRGKLPLSDNFRRMLLLAPDLNGNLPGTRSTLMHLAARRNDPQLAQLLLAAGFSDRGDIDRLTPWREALQFGSREFVEFCKENNLQTVDEPTDYVQYNFCRSVLDKDAAAVRKYLNAGADPKRKFFNNMDALENACLNNDVATAKELFSDPGYANSARQAGAWIYGRPLFIAAAAGAESMLEFLLTQGVKPQLKVSAELLSFVAFADKYTEVIADDAGRFLTAFVIYNSSFIKSADDSSVPLLRLLEKFDMYNIDDFGHVMLHMVANKKYGNAANQRHLLRYLLARGADPGYINGKMVDNRETAELIDRAKSSYRPKNSSSGGRTVRRNHH